jgi:hypothetical protein
MSNSNDNSSPKVVNNLDVYFALGQYVVMVLNAIFFLHGILFISLNLLAATMLLISFLYLCKIRNPFYPYLTFAIMICYFIITIEILFDVREGFIGIIIRIISFILFIPWVIYAIKTIRTPLVARDKILRMWTTYSHVEDEKEREDYTDGIDHARTKLRQKRKEVRGKYNAFIIQIVGAIYVVFFVVTYLYGLL